MMWLIMPLHNPPSLVALSNVCPITIPHSPCSSIYIHKLILLTSVCHVCIKISKPYFLIFCPGNFNCLFLIQSINVLFVSTSFQTSSPLTYSLHGILSILQQKQNSVAISVLFIFEKIVHHSLLYNMTASFINNSSSDKLYQQQQVAPMILSPVDVSVSLPHPLPFPPFWSICRGEGGTSHFSPTTTRTQ